MTAREDALAAFERISADHGASTILPPVAALPGDTALVRAALAPDLPADLAEIQSRVDYAAAAWQHYVDDGYKLHSEVFAVYERTMQRLGADVPVLVAELVALRAAPRLTAEEARKVLHLIERYIEPRFGPDQPLTDTLRAIADQKAR